MTGWTLEDLPVGRTVFIDSSVFLYHFFRSSEQARRFLRRCEEGELRGITSTLVLLEVSHRLMAVEAVVSGLVLRGDVVRKLRERPDVVRQLSASARQVQQIGLWGLDIRPVDIGVVMRSAEVRATTGLMTNDSVIVATMRTMGLTAIATADADFTRVEGLQVYRPTDVASAPPLA